MPSQETQYRKQIAVLWEKDTTNPYGELRVRSPYEIVVRWENKRSEIPGPNGEPVALDAVVMINQRIYPGSLMWLGELADWVGTGSEYEDNGLMQVATYEETPDLKNRVAYREVGLIRYRQTLPEGM